MIPMIAWGVSQPALGDGKGNGAAVTWKNGVLVPADPYFKPNPPHSVPANAKPFRIEEYPGLAETIVDITQFLATKSYGVTFNQGPDTPLGVDSSYAFSGAQGYLGFHGTFFLDAIKNSQVVFVDALSGTDPFPVESGETMEVAFSYDQVSYQEDKNAFRENEIRHVIELKKDLFDKLGSDENSRAYQAVVLIHEAMHRTLKLDHELICPVLGNIPAALNVRKRQREMKNVSAPTAISGDEFQSLETLYYGLRNLAIKLGPIALPEKSYPLFAVSRSGGGIIALSRAAEKFSGLLDNSEWIKRAGESNYVDVDSNVFAVLGPNPDLFGKNPVVTTPLVMSGNIVSNSTVIFHGPALVERSSFRDSQIQFTNVNSPTEREATSVQDATPAASLSAPLLPIREVNVTESRVEIKGTPMAGIHQSEISKLVSSYRTEKTAEFVTVHILGPQTKIDQVEASELSLAKGASVSGLTLRYDESLEKNPGSERKNRITARLERGARLSGIQITVPVTRETMGIHFDLNWEASAKDLHLFLADSMSPYSPPTQVQIAGGVGLENLTFEHFGEDLTFFGTGHPQGSRIKAAHFILPNPESATKEIVFIPAGKSIRFDGKGKKYDFSGTKAKWWDTLRGYPASLHIPYDSISQYE